MLAIFRAQKALCIGVAATLIIVAIFACYMLFDRDQPVLTGQNIVVTITADSLTDIYGYQFQMTYDKEKLEYTGTLTSKIEDILTTFSKPMEGYELVGATMVGDKSGVSGRNIAVCEMVFTVLKDDTLGDLDISIGDVKVIQVIQSDLESIEDVEDWNLKKAVQE